MVQAAIISYGISYGRHKSREADNRYVQQPHRHVELTTHLGHLCPLQVDASFLSWTAHCKGMLSALIFALREASSKGPLRCVTMPNTALEPLKE